MLKINFGFGALSFCCFWGMHVAHLPFGEMMCISLSFEDSALSGERLQLLPLANLPLAVPGTEPGSSLCLSQVLDTRTQAGDLWQVLVCNGLG